MFRHWFSALRRAFGACPFAPADRPCPADLRPATEADRIRAKIAKWTLEAKEFERLGCSTFARDTRERVALYTRHLAAIEGSAFSRVA